MLDLHRSRSFNAARCLAIGVACAAASLATGCTSDSAPGNMPNEGGACPMGGGPIAGMAMTDCTTPYKEVGACMKEPLDGGDTAGDAGVEMLPEPSIGTENLDDDCKYHVAFTNDCVQKGGTGTTFNVSLTSLTKNMAVVPGAKTYIEAYLTPNHPAGGDTLATETSPGVYKVGPVMFDASGKWTVRFHFFGDCSDVPADSPHAHAAFYINVP